MADVTYYVALPFAAGDEGAEPHEAVECTSANAAIRSAERMARAEGTRRRGRVQPRLPPGPSFLRLGFAVAEIR